MSDDEGYKIHKNNNISPWDEGTPMGISVNSRRKAVLLFTDSEPLSSKKLKFKSLKKMLYNLLSF